MAQFTDAPIFDADQHMYETPDALTRYLPEQYRRSVQFVQLGRATRIAIRDTALVPLYWPKLYWATRGKVTYVPGKDEDTRASLAGLAP